MAYGKEVCAGIQPPAWASRFRSDDLDEVRAVIARADVEHSRVAHCTGPLGYEIAWLIGEVASVAWARVDLPTTIRGRQPKAVLHIGMPSGSRYGVGRHDFLTGPHDAMFVADGLEFTGRCPPGMLMALDLDTAALKSEIAARSAGGPAELSLRTQPLVHGTGSRQRLLVAVSSLAAGTAPGAPAETARHREGRVLGVIASLLLEQFAVVRTRRATTTRIVELEDWIEANLNQPISAGKLCRVAGVSQRRLEKIFESRRAMSPMRFVAERRLAAAQRLLDTAVPGDDVTRIALSLGFSHIGRFSSLYRQTFGELPSQTLQRGLRRRG